MYVFDKSRTEEEEPKQLYTVLPQKETSITGFMGSQHVYDISNATSASKGTKVTRHLLSYHFKKYLVYSPNYCN
jgi:hypothetical protein